MLKILVPGRTGQVGWELQSALAPLGTVLGLDRSEMDLASPDSIRRAIRDAKPDVIVNAAAYSNVGRAEVQYKTTDYYAPQHERCIAWNDRDLAISWPLASEPILSPKDRNGLPLRQAKLFP